MVIVKAYDFETTGVDPNKCEPLQLAVVTAKLEEDGSYEVWDTFETIIKIEADSVPDGAQRVHGISKEVTELRGLDSSVIRQNLEGTVLGYNNQRYDDIIAKRYDVIIGQSFDVFKLAQRAKRLGLLAKASLGSVYESVTGKKAENAHDALADVMMTLDCLKPLMQMLEIENIYDAYSAMESEAKFMTMPFGKYKGMLVKDLPHSYVNWMRENINLSSDLKEAIDAHF